MSNFKQRVQKQQSMFKSKISQEMKQRPDAFLKTEEFYYDDASSYAKEYYGEVFSQTTRFDNDWD